MSKVKVSDSVTESVTRSPIELFWTAKKGLGKYWNNREDVDRFD